MGCIQHVCYLHRLAVIPTVPARSLRAFAFHKHAHARTERRRAGEYGYNRSAYRVRCLRHTYIVILLVFIVALVRFVLRARFFIACTVAIWRFFLAALASRTAMFFAVYVARIAPAI